MEQAIVMTHRTKPLIKVFTLFAQFFQILCPFYR
jgi:hypothetical protein